MAANRKRLLAYVPMARFIAEMNGPDAEAVLHDISQPSRSIIYITPKSITGRCVGGPLTDYAMELLQQGVYLESDHVVNYVGRAHHRDLVLRSSTFFIKEEGQLIGLLCVNIDLTRQFQALDLLQDALLIPREDTNKRTSEVFSLTADELILQTIRSYSRFMEPAQMPVELRRAIVAKLVTLGVFSIKGAVSQAAAHLHVSEQTIYRYLAELEKKERNHHERNHPD